MRWSCEQWLLELLSLPLHQQQGLCLCVLIHFLSVPFKIIPLFLSLFQLVPLSGGQDSDDKLHQCCLPVALVLFHLRSGSTLQQNRPRSEVFFLSLGFFLFLTSFQSNPRKNTDFFCKWGKNFFAVVFNLYKEADKNYEVFPLTAFAACVVKPLQLSAKRRMRSMELKTRWLNEGCTIGSNVWWSVCVCVCATGNTSRILPCANLSSPHALHSAHTHRMSRQWNNVFLNILLSCTLDAVLIEIGCYIMVGINQGLPGTLGMARWKRPLLSVSSCWLHGDVLLHNQRASYK